MCLVDTQHTMSGPPNYPDRSAHAQDLSLNVLFAGHETTTKALLLLLQRLKQHPAALASLREEQQKVAHSPFRPKTSPSIKPMSR